MKLELFHKIADADCAAIRREISEAGLKPVFDFRNVDTMDAAVADLTARGGSVGDVPCVWDGTTLTKGRAAISSLIARLPKT